VFVVRVPTGEAFMVNKKGYEILGISGEQQTKRNILAISHDFIKKDGTPYPIEELPLSITLREGRIDSKGNIFILRAGSKVSLKVSSAPVRDKEGRIVAAIMVFEETKS